MLEGEEQMLQCTGIGGRSGVFRYLHAVRQSHKFLDRVDFGRL